MDLDQTVLQPDSGDRVDGAEGLVHEEHRRIGGEGPRDAHPLLLAAGHVLREPCAELRRIQADEIEQVLGALGDAALVPAEQTRDRADVALDRPVREQSAGLDDVADRLPQLVRVLPRHVPAVDQDPAGGRLDQAVDHLQRRRLAAAGRADEGHHLAGGDLQIECGDGRLGLTAEVFLNAVQRDGRAGDVGAGAGGAVGHVSPLGMVSRPSRTRSASKTSAMATISTVPVTAISSALAPPSRARPLKINEPSPGPST